MGARGWPCPPGGGGQAGLSSSCPSTRGVRAAFLELLKAGWEGQAHSQSHPLYSVSFPPTPRSELIQLVAVTQKTAERSYREHIEQQIQTYQRRCELPFPHPTLCPPPTPPSQSQDMAQLERGQERGTGALGTQAFSVW